MSGLCLNFLGCAKGLNAIRKDDLITDNQMAIRTLKCKYLGRRDCLDSFAERFP